MTKKTRRDVLTSGTIAAAAALVPGNTAAQNAPVGGADTIGNKFDTWSNTFSKSIGGLSEADQLQIFKQNGVNDIDELTLKFMKRYPEMDPDKIPITPKLREILDAFAPLNQEKSSRSYQSSPKHDKEPYEKTGSHDRMGFSRT